MAPPPGFFCLDWGWWWWGSERAGRFGVRVLRAPFFGGGSTLINDCRQDLGNFVAPPDPGCHQVPSPLAQGCKQAGTVSLCHCLLGAVSL